MSSRGRGGLGLAATWQAAAPHTASVVERMLVASSHRGETIQVATCPCGAVGVSGEQRVGGTAADDGGCLAFAGVIDNPEVLGASPDAFGDELAYALLSAVRSRGAAIVANSLRGSFAVVGIDPGGATLFRDHLGLGSLFYRHRGDQAWIASEAKQVVAGAGINRAPDLDVVEAVFFGTASDETPAALEGVERAPRARITRLALAGRSGEVFWDPGAKLETSSEEDIRERFDLLMHQAVRRAMRGPDVVSLSGGVDSPAVAAFAAPLHQELYGHPLGAASLVYPHLASVDESRYIRLVAEELGLPLATRSPEARPTDGLDRWVRLVDGPFPVVSIAESVEFYSWVKSLGYDVVLTGEWAEYVTELSSHALAHMLQAGRWTASSRRIAAERAMGRTRTEIVRRAAKSLLPGSALTVIRRSLGRSARGAPPPWILDTRSALSDRKASVRRRWVEDQLSFFGGSGVLLDAHNAVTALCRVDVRRPFADIDVWELFLGLRAEVKHGDPRRKGLLRDLLRGRVPDPILDRRDKTVFDADLLSKIDYDFLDKWLLDPRHRMPWIDYGRLADSIKGRSVGLLEFMWMKDLAAVHAFLEDW